MIRGIGTDIVKKSRIEILLGHKGGAGLSDPFFQRIYTQKEILQAVVSGDMLSYLSGRFAAKEAIFKSLKVDGDAVKLGEIEILRDLKGLPQVSLLGSASKLSVELGISKIELSISHEEELSIAYAVALS